MRLIDADTLRRDLRAALSWGEWKNAAYVLDHAPTVRCLDCADYENCIIEDVLNKVRRAERLVTPTGCTYFRRRR